MKMKMPTKVTEVPSYQSINSFPGLIGWLQGALKIQQQMLEECLDSGRRMTKEDIEKNINWLKKTRVESDLLWRYINYGEQSSK